MTAIPASSLEEAVDLAASFKATGRYQLFRGQSRDLPVVSSLNRLGEAERTQALARLDEYWAWVKHLPELAGLAANPDDAIAVAQHYGLPTNFVDFTTEPEAAGFFASASPNLVAGQPSCLICLNTERLEAISAGMSTFTQGPEILPLDVSNLWRLQAQHGVFLFLPHVGIEVYYEPFDRIVFPAGQRANEASRRQYYPARRSQLELILDQYFMWDGMRKGNEQLADLPLSIIHKGAADGLNRELVDPRIDHHPSWSTSNTDVWRVIADERLETVRRGDQVALRFDVTDSLESLSAVVERQVLDTLSSQPHLRERLVDWACVDATASVDHRRLEAALAWMWDGVRRLPYIDADMAAAFGMCAAVHVAELLQERRQQPWWDAATGAMGKVTRVEFGTLDKTYARAFVRDADLRDAVREDIAEYLVPEFRDEILASGNGMLQAVQTPSILFDFNRFTRLFIRQVIPTQVLTRADYAAFFSPTKLTRFGLP